MKQQLHKSCDTVPVKQCILSGMTVCTDLAASSVRLCLQLVTACGICQLLKSACMPGNGAYPLSLLVQQHNAALPAQRWCGRAWQNHSVNRSSKLSRQMQCIQLSNSVAQILHLLLRLFSTVPFVQQAHFCVFKTKPMLFVNLLFYYSHND